MPAFCRCPGLPDEPASPVCPVCGLGRVTPADAGAPAADECGPCRRGRKARHRGRLPRVVGYRLLRVVGRGGMGVVYQAWQLDLKRFVAVKTIADPTGLVRFRTEARAIARLQHPNIVQVYDQKAEPRHGPPYLIMEWVDGGSLAQQLGGKPWPAPRAARLVEALARAVHYAHGKDVAHRDLKPSNVLLTSDGTPKVSDFGLAKLLDRRDNPTKTGSRLGTCAYMAPEQATARPGTDWQLADVYGLGAILYETLTGRPPFQAAVETETLRQVLEMDPVPPRRLQPDVPRDLETVCLKCLDKDPRRRYPSALALADDLGRHLRGEPVKARPVGLAGRFIRWGRRKPALASLTVALAATIAVGLPVSIAGWLQAAHNFREAEEQYKALRQLMTNNVHVSATWHAGFVDENPLPTALLTDAEASLSRLLEKRPEDQELRVLLADVLTRLGMRQWQTESPSPELFERAARLWEQVPQELAREPKCLTSRASTHEHLALAYYNRGRNGPALREFEASFLLFKQLAEERPTPRHRDALFYAALELGGLLLVIGHPEDEVRRRFEEFRARPELLGEGGSDAFFDNLRVRKLCTAASGNYQAKRPTAGLCAAREAAAILERYFREPSPDKKNCPRLARPAYLVSTELRRGGAVKESLQFAENVTRSLRQLARDAPDDHVAVTQLSESWQHVGKAYWEMDRIDETLHAYRSSLATQQQACILAPTVVEYRRDLGTRFLQLGRKLCELGRLDEAETCFRQRQALWPDDRAWGDEALRELRKWADQTGQNIAALSSEKRLERQRYLDLLARLEGAPASVPPANP